MKTRVKKDIGIVGINSGNLSSGVGYIIIPKKVQDIPLFKKHCYANNTVCISGGQGHNQFYDVPIDENSIKSIIFPEKVGEYGSPVVWLNIPKQNKPVIVAVLRPLGDVYHLEEFSHRTTRTFKNNVVDITSRAQSGTLDISVVANNDDSIGKINLSVSNRDENCEFNVSVKGKVNINSSDSHIINSDEEISLNVIDDSGEIRSSVSLNKDGFIKIKNRNGDTISIEDDGITISTNKDMSIASGENSVSLDDSGVTISAGTGSIFVNGANDVLYSKIPGASEIVDVAQIGVSKTVKVGS